MNIILALVFIILNVIDIITTNIILENGGTEANPIVRFLMKHGLFIPLKIIMTVFVAYLVVGSVGTGVIVCLIMIIVVSNNCYQIYSEYKGR